MNYIPQITRNLLFALCYINPEAKDSKKSKLILGPIQDDSFDSSILEIMINLLVDPIWKRYYTLEMLNKIQTDYRVVIGKALLGL